MNYNLNNSYGQMLANQIAASVGPVFGRILVVVGDSDKAEKKDMMSEMFVPDPQGVVRFYSTLKAAYDAAVTNADDVILLSGHSSHVIANGIAWTKSRIHVIGMDGGDRLVQQGAKVVSTVGAADAYVLKVTGTRNSFINIKFVQNDTNAAALNVVQMGGEGTLYKNCSFTFGVIDNLDLTTASEVLNGEDSGTFINCQFGQDTLLSTAATRTIMTIDQVTTSQEFKSNIFRDCTWLGSSDDADLQCISMAASGDILFTNHFIRPSFIASIDSAGGIQCTKAVSTANGTTKGTILISYPMVHGFLNMAINGTNNDNILVVAPLNVSTDIVGIAPIAT